MQDLIEKKDSSIRESRVFLMRTLLLRGLRDFINRNGLPHGMHLHVWYLQRGRKMTLLNILLLRLNELAWSWRYEVRREAATMKVVNVLKLTYRC
jgi:hypothetical protein